MSSRKTGISNEFVDRLKAIIEYLGFDKRQKSVFAKKIGISPSFMSDVLGLRSGPSFLLIYGITKEFPGIDPRWLITGEGDDPRSWPSLLETLSRADEALEGQAKENSHVHELLRMAKDILNSDQSYSRSLAANIRSFHEAITTFRELNTIREQQSQLRSEVDEMREWFRHVTGRTRRDDPDDKKDEFIKMRVISSVINGDGAPTGS